MAQFLGDDVVVPGSVQGGAYEQLQGGDLADKVYLVALQADIAPERAVRQAALAGERVEQQDSGVGADPPLALGPLVAAARLAAVLEGEQSAVFPGQAGVRGHPEPAVRIFPDLVYRAEGGIVNYGVLRRFQRTQTLYRGHPDSSGAVLVELVGGGLHPGYAADLPASDIVSVHSVGRTYPYQVAVGQQREDEVVAYGVLVFRVVDQVPVFIAVVAVQAGQGGNPHVSQGVLGKGPDPKVGQFVRGAGVIAPLPGGSQAEHACQQRKQIFADSTHQCKGNNFCR